VIRVTVAFLVVFALAGCVGGAEPTPPPPGRPSPIQTVEPSASPAPSAAGWQPSGNPVDPAAYAHPDGGVAFSSPSGNIQCGYSTYREPGWWWCLLVQYSVELPPSDECVGEYTDGSPITPNGLGVTGSDPDALPESFCAFAGEGPTLAYGQSIAYRDMACDSTEDGMTCRNLVSGHGFRLSRSDYELF